MVKFILLIISLVSISFSFSPQEELAGSTALITQSARAKACGSASSTITNDISLATETPNAICESKGYNLYIQHMNFLLDMYSETINISKSFNNFAVGVSLNYFDYNNISLNDEYNRNENNASYKAFDFSSSLLIGYTFNKAISSAVALKYLKKEIWYFASHGYSIDFSTVYNTPIKGLKTAILLKNIGTTSSFIDTNSTTFRLIPNYKIGFSYTYSLKENTSLTLSSDISITENDSSYITIPLGLEYRFKKNFMLRTGYHIFDNSESFSLGFRVLFKNAYLDYSYSIYQDGFEIISNPHLFGIGFSF